jgi:ADP-heptose:LPS heptosyltransferase
VYEEQGFGDTLMFCRYLHRVKSLGGRLVFEVRKPLAELFKNFPGIDELIVRSEDAPQQLRFNRYLPLMSIARVFETTLANIPADIPYLFSDVEKAAHYKQAMAGEGLKIGIVWEGSRKHTNDKIRSTTLNHFKMLAKIKGATFFSFQKEVSAADGNLLRMLQINNLGPHFTDFSDTAAAIENLDLLISVDTSVAHLAGAMGKPVWLLIPFIPDWRWRMGANRSPWYPQMRLFRQKTRGDWESVFDTVARNLGNLILKNIAGANIQHNHSQRKLM